MSVDKARLLAWLHEKAAQHNALAVYAVLEGLAQRVERGDFDREEEEA